MLCSCACCFFLLKSHYHVPYYQTPTHPSKPNSIPLPTWKLSGPSSQTDPLLPAQNFQNTLHRAIGPCQGRRMREGLLEEETFKHRPQRRSRQKGMSRAFQTVWTMCAKVKKPETAWGMRGIQVLYQGPSLTTLAKKATLFFIVTLHGFSSLPANYIMCLFVDCYVSNWNFKLTRAGTFSSSLTSVSSSWLIITASLTTARSWVPRQKFGYLVLYYIPSTGWRHSRTLMNISDQINIAQKRYSIPQWINAGMDEWMQVCMDIYTQHMNWLIHAWIQLSHSYHQSPEADSEPPHLVLLSFRGFYLILALAIQSFFSYPQQPHFYCHKGQQAISLKPLCSEPWELTRFPALLEEVGWPWCLDLFSL